MGKIRGKISLWRLILVKSICFWKDLCSDNPDGIGKWWNFRRIFLERQDSFLIRSFSQICEENFYDRIWGSKGKSFWSSVLIINVRLSCIPDIPLDESRGNSRIPRVTLYEVVKKVRWRADTKREKSILRVTISRMFTTFDNFSFQLKDPPTYDPL